MLRLSWLFHFLTLLVFRSGFAGTCVWLPVQIKQRIQFLPGLCDTSLALFLEFPTDLGFDFLCRRVEYGSDNQFCRLQVSR